MPAVKSKLLSFNTKHSADRTRLVQALIALTVFSGIALAQDTPRTGTPQSAISETVPDFTLGIIPPITLASDGHLHCVKNGVQFDVFYNTGPKHSAVIYAINTGRKQLVLTPEKHRAILENLLDRNFTVIVADFKAKPLSGLELERYVVQLTEDAREAADGTLSPTPLLRSLVPNRAPKAPSRTETSANDYFTLMPGFTVERDVTWFRYGDVPEPLRKEIARQLDKPFRAEDAEKTNGYDIIYPAYGPSVGVLTNYASSENERQEYYPLKTASLVMAFALKNLAVVHQQYFNDPIGGYHKGYDYYGDQFALCFIRHLKGNASRFHIDPEKICCFGHSKGSEVPGMLLNRLRANAPYSHSKADFKKVVVRDQDKVIPSPYSHLPAHIACAILGAGIANSELANDKLNPWAQDPVKNISPFFLYADHRPAMRLATQTAIAKAKAHGVRVETAELYAHTWPFGAEYDRASEFADQILQPEY